MHWVCHRLRTISNVRRGRQCNNFSEMLTDAVYRTHTTKNSQTNVPATKIGRIDTYSTTGTSFRRRCSSLFSEETAIFNSEGPENTGKRNVYNCCAAVKAYERYPVLHVAFVRLIVKVPWSYYVQESWINEVNTWMLWGVREMRTTWRDYPKRIDKWSGLKSPNGYTTL